MKSFVVAGMVLITSSLHGQIAVLGVVTEQNSNNKPLPGVQVKVLGSAPDQSGRDGVFRLVFTTKQPGDRVVVSEISKKGYEIVNKEMVDNWVIQKEPATRFKIVMCPEGTVARNTMKYYNISLDGLTKGYDSRIRVLQQQKEKSEIDAKTYAEQARLLSEQFQNQQKQLEELAEKFARENFDDCSDIHRKAFEAFSAGHIPDAIRILESVNSAEEIRKALEQKEKGRNAELEGKLMQQQSDSIIRQHISKLLFQAELYKSEFRFAEAEKMYETAISADSNDVKLIFTYVAYLLDQMKIDEAYRWDSIGLSRAVTPREKGFGLHHMGFILKSRKQFDVSEQALKESIGNYTQADSANIKLYKAGLSLAMEGLAEYYYDVNQYHQSITLHQEALKIRREQAIPGDEQQLARLAQGLVNLGLAQQRVNDHVGARNSFREALGIFREMDRKNPGTVDGLLAWDLMGLAQESDSTEADACFQEALGLLRNLTEKNFDANGHFLARLLTAYANFKKDHKDFQTAKAYYLDALNIGESLMKTNPLVYSEVYASTLSNLASLEDDLNALEQAMEHYQMALKVYRELAGYGPGAYNLSLALTLHNMAFLFRKMKQYEKASACYEESAQFLREEVKTNPEEGNGALVSSLVSHANMLYEAGDTVRAAQYSIESMALVDKLVAESPEMYTHLAGISYHRFSWTQVKNRQFWLAESFSRRGLQTDSTQILINTNLALALLFQDRYDEALQIYLKYKDMPVPDKPNETMRDSFLQDFIDLEKMGITHPDVEKIRKELAN
ncbi:MAG TPA: tetratricopeptide repeat protein [Bacteroidales bacterium]|nr:tetratricopeptide repeat protein [Bacteroidales bacterium]HRZ47792.1 tetratricopeptide repeat protein [Bacteroidales bacterium]